VSLVNQNRFASFGPNPNEKTSTFDIIVTAVYMVGFGEAFARKQTSKSRRMAVR
jgi:hypothetical protein